MPKGMSHEEARAIALDIVAAHGAGVRTAELALMIAKMTEALKKAYAAGQASTR